MQSRRVRSTGQTDGYQQLVYDDFKEQMRRSDEGWYETGLLWKHGHDLLPNTLKGKSEKTGKPP